MKTEKKKYSPRHLVFIWGVGEIILAIGILVLWQDEAGILYWIKGIIFSAVLLFGILCIKDGFFASDEVLLTKMARGGRGKGRGKDISFASDLIPLILNGSKTLTYRLGDKYASLNVGDMLNIRDSSSDMIFAIAEVTEKSTVPFGELPIDRKGHEVYPSKDAQRKIFKQYYGRDIEDDELMLVLGFRIIAAGH